jgi:alanyl aminopeptidase
LADRIAGAILVLALLLGCGVRPAPALPPSEPPAAGAATATAPPPPREDGRLPVTVTPERYRLELRIDPAQPRFSGITTIKVTVSEPTAHVVLNARGMSIVRASARIGGVEIDGTATPRTSSAGVEPEELVLTFSRPLPVGSALLEIVYDAPFAPDLAGLYRVSEGAAFYAYTQFEATDARRAFPCFDEPGFKTPYEVTITSPRSTMAIANSPETSGGETLADGMVVHRFAPTPPLPSYLVAFAVGGFDVAEGQRDPFPIRVLTTKGRAGLAALALEDAAALVAKLAEYFGIPYPFAKLDLVAVPDFAVGAMENPGLVTFRDVLLLVDPDRATTALRRIQAAAIAQELAHQWFGDLVTMQWWDDLWLNEGFATWAEAKMLDAWKPAFGESLAAIAVAGHVMDADALKSARAVRQPVRSRSDAMDAFDGLTYDKGAAVLRMIEGWLGADMFRRGVQQYLRQNAWKNARADDLFHALEYVSTEKVGPLVNGFLDHPGVPEVVSMFTCGGGHSTLELRQSEWRPLGTDVREPRSWTIPVCVASDTDKTRTCFTLGADPIVRELGPSCPSWVYPNADQGGYYRVVVDRSKLLLLARAGRSLDPRDRLGIVSNAWAAVRQGAIDPGVLFDVLAAFDSETNRIVVDEVIGVLRAVDQTLVDDATRPAFRRYVTARLIARKHRLGWYALPGAPADDEARLERLSVLRALGEVAGDRATLDEADKYAARWLKDPANVPSDIASVAVPLASARAGMGRFEELRAAVARAASLEDRAIAIHAMGSFDDPPVVSHVLDLALGDELKLSELGHLFGTTRDHRAARATLYAWEKQNWAKLRARLPGSFGYGMLIGVAGTMCTPGDRADAQAFFGPATEGLEGVKRPLDEALESTDLCIALRQHGARDVSKYFESR